MPKRDDNPVWEFYTKISDTRAICTFCNVDYAYASTTANLLNHLKKKHPAAYDKVMDVRKLLQKMGKPHNGEQNVIYLIAENQKLSDDDVLQTTMVTDTDVILDARDSRPSVLKRKQRESNDNRGVYKKRLIDQLTEEKIAVASVQKELMEKQLEETSLKVLLLQEEMEHRKRLHNLEKQEMKRKTEIQDLTKLEMLLKIELLKASLSKESPHCTVLNDPNMPSIEIESTE